MPPLPSHDEALHAALEAARGALCPGGELRTRRRALRLCLGATLAEPVVADRDLPPFDRATMDGYAVRAEDVERGARLRVVGAVAAGGGASVDAPPETCVAIATGAPVPPGLNAVIPHELTDQGQGEVTLHCDPVAPGHCVHARGSDAREGQRLLEEGRVLDPAAIGVAAAVGVARPLIRGGRPSVRIVSSGDELRPVDTPAASLALHQIRDSNAPALAAVIPLFGGTLESTVHVPDEEAPTVDALRDAIEAADVVVTIGGVSAGARDRFPRAIESLGFRWAVRGVNIQPGKPFSLAVGMRVGEGWSGLVVCLPGNPVSVMVTAHLFLWPALRALAGAAGPLPWVRRALGAAVRPNPQRETFRPAARESGTGAARVVEWSGSGDLAHLASTHGVARLPVQSEPVAPGTVVDVLPWAWEEW